MGWKTRGGLAYYYQSERHGDRVASRYVGGGETARLISQMEAIDREERSDERERERAKARRLEKISAKVQGVCRALALAADALIESAGYHRHHRGPWRRRRTMSGTTAPAAIAGPTPGLAERYKAGDRDARKEVQALIDEAQKGDHPAAARIADLIKAAPVLADRLGADLAGIAEDSLIRRAYGKNALASAEAARHRLAEIRAELAGPNPSAIERLLAERAAVCWLDCHYTDYLEHEAKERSYRQADFMARQRDRAHRRYLSALKALASVRKLPIMAVQVNVGRNAVG